MEEFNSILQRYPKRRAAILGILRILEEKRNGISEEELLETAKAVGVSPAEVLGTFSFYTHFKRKGEGKYVIRVCCTLPCALRGADELYDHICRKLVIKDGQTTPDGLFTLKKVECLAGCDKGPFVQINEQDYPCMSPEEVDRIIDSLSR